MRKFKIIPYYDQNSNVLNCPYVGLYNKPSPWYRTPSRMMCCIYLSDMFGIL